MADQPVTGRVRKLRWKCRRGMKELDILLERFLSSNADALAAGEWPEFDQLLSLEDDQLWDCMLQPEKPEFSDFRKIIAAIRPSNSGNA